MRRDGTSSVRYRRAMMLLASVGGNRVPVIAQLVQADEDTVRDVIHRFNEIGLACLDPRWSGGRPRLLSPDDEDFVVATATTRPTKLGQPFTRWSIRKLAAYLRKVHGRLIRIGREALRCLLARRGVTFQRTKTWKESPDPDRDAKLDRIEQVLEQFPDRVFAFDEFGPLGIRPTVGSCWAEQGRPERHPATYHRTHGVRYFHGCYSIGDDFLWGVKPQEEGRREHAVRAEVDPRGPPGRRSDLREFGQPVRPQGRDDPALGEEDAGRVVLHPDLRVLGQPDRGPLRATAAVHDRQLPPPQPHRPDPGPARLPALAQRQRPSTTFSQPSAANAPASAARKASAGADAHSQRQSDHTAPQTVWLRPRERTALRQRFGRRSAVSAW